MVSGIHFVIWRKFSFFSDTDSSCVMMSIRGTSRTPAWLWSVRTCEVVADEVIALNDTLLPHNQQLLVCFRDYSRNRCQKSSYHVQLAADVVVSYSHVSNPLPRISKIISIPELCLSPGWLYYILSVRVCYGNLFRPHYFCSLKYLKWASKLSYFCWTVSWLMSLQTSLDGRI